MKIFSDNIAFTKDSIIKVWENEDGGMIFEINVNNVRRMFESKYETRKVDKILLIVCYATNTIVLSVNYDNGDIVQLHDGNTYSFNLSKEERSIIKSISK